MKKPDMYKPFFAAQAPAHPAMQPRDAVKLCFQAAFGAEHLIADEAAAKARLAAEFADTPADAAAPLYERIGPDAARVHLAAWKAADIPLSWLERLFLLSAKENAQADAELRKEDFAQALLAARELADAGVLPFPGEALDAFCREAFSGGLKPVHHSDAYRLAEKPAYRVVSGTFVRILPLLAPLARLDKQIFPAVAAIDGRAASGKSTAGAQLSAVTGAGLVHMDDFFPRMETRSPERLAEPGGNVDYTRFALQVLPALRSPKPFSYPTFDCDIMAIRGQREVAGGTLRIVEGSYSHHPYFAGYAALRVFSDIDPQEQMRRIVLRNGEEKAQMFRDRWIPMEERYFTALSIREKADILI